MYIDRDIDALMDRTSQRPLVTGMVTPRECLAFGISLAVVSTVWFGLLVNWLSAALALGALLFYVVVYTMLLKRRTSQNIVWGGIAGCMPVLIGWSAVTNTVSWAAVILFAVIFFWTPPHYWPLSMKVKDDYARVGVPMLPVIASNRVVAKQIVLYSWVMVAVSLLPHPAGLHGLVLHRGGAALRWRLALGGPRAAEPGQGRGDRGQAQGDAAVPLVHHLRLPALPRRRGGPLPPLTPPLPATGGSRGTSHATRPSPVHLPVGSILSMAETAADAADTEQTSRTDARKAARAERRAAKLAREIGAFAKRHGGAEGQLAYIGQAGARIVLVGQDGAWGDLVAPTYAVAQGAAAKSGITMHDEFDGDFALKVRTGPYEWSRMASRWAAPPTTAEPRGRARTRKGAAGMVPAAPFAVRGGAQPAGAGAVSGCSAEDGPGSGAGVSSPRSRMLSASRSTAIHMMDEPSMWMPTRSSGTSVKYWT